MELNISPNVYELQIGATFFSLPFLGDRSPGANTAVK